MLDKDVAVRYGNVFFDIASRSGKEDAWRAQLEGISETIKASKFLETLLSSPSISRTVKKESLDKLFTGRVDEIVLNFLKVIVDKGRFLYFKFIYEKFCDRIRHSREIMGATITTAVPLDKKEKENLLKALSIYFSSELEGDFVVDPFVMGGVKILVDGTLIDGTLSKRLAEIRERMMSASFPNLRS